MFHSLDIMFYVHTGCFVAEDMNSQRRENIYTYVFKWTL